ncbi:MAG: tripartite tricarboxylate transporter substrate binding protein [Acetobacteraceae bacterium]|nr:tripartite tricarboxylate transporter substrate binding protein [Acetobacteraceae bacterium]
MIRRRAALAGTLAAPFAAPLARAETWSPDRPVRLVVGFAAGGGTDITARTMAQRLQQEIGQPIVVENRPGAGGNIATEAVVRAAPDGYTLLLGTIAALAVNPSLFKNLSFDPQTDLTPISMAGDVLNILVCAPEKPFRSVADLITAAKAAPETLSYGSSGVGGTGHLAGALFDRMAGIRTIHVPYRGGGPLSTDILSGKVDFSFATASTTLPHVQVGKLRALAVPTLKRSTLLPDIPAMSETLAGYDVPNWNALVGPKGLPDAVVARYNAALRAALADPEVRKSLVTHGVEPTPSSPQELARFMREQTDKWRPVIEATGASAG